MTTGCFRWTAFINCRQRQVFHPSRFSLSPASRLHSNMAAAAPIYAATGNAPAMNGPTVGSSSASSGTGSLPSSPSAILKGLRSTDGTADSVTDAIAATFVAAPIPKSVRESFGAYFRHREGAAAELHLYRHTGFFDGATLHNAPNTDLKTAFDGAANKVNGKVDGDAKSHLQAALHTKPSTATASLDGVHRATVATEPASNGKVGSIRMIDIGQPTQAVARSKFTSWFSSPMPRLINMLEIGTPRPAQEAIDDAEEEKVVLLHGYGAGTAFFYNNLRSLGQLPQSRLYALDWLGMGRSSRVPFHITSKESKTTETRVEAAERFFVDALEDWRRTMGVKKMTLVGHSLGGYLSIAYSLKFPQHVSRVVLLSPAGIPEAPVDTKRTSQPTSASQNADDAIAKEIQQSQGNVAPASNVQARQDEVLVGRASKKAKTQGNNDVKERVQSLRNDGDDSEGGAAATGQDEAKPPRMKSRTRNIVQFLWEQNLSPFALLRGSFLFAPMLAGGYTSRRFAALPDEDLRTLHAYCYDIFTSRGSSEYCLAHILAAFGYARLPMVHRVAALPKTLPVTFIYGETGIDWMSIDGGIEAVRRLKDAGNPHGRCFAVPHAGHHVYLDNPKAFDALLTRVLMGKADNAGKAGQNAAATVAS